MAFLSGIRVIDLTRLLPGAVATLMLAELGAEVIKMEDPDGGDPTRRLPPFVGGRSVYDLLLNRGKKSVALDLRRPESAAVLDELASTADVFIESYRPGTARKIGIAAEQVRARHPRLVHCSITGYGQTGPYAERPGHDLNYVSISGLLAADRPGILARAPYAELPRMFLADVGGGAMSAVIGILAALVGRARTGEGASLDISMHDAALYWVMLPAARELIEGGEQAEGGLPTFGSHASYHVYPTKDGTLVALGALEEKFWRGFCEAVGRPDLTARHATDLDDQAALLDEVCAIFASRTRDEWLALLGSRDDVCLTPVNTPAEAFRDPHIAARGTIIQGPGLRAVRPPFGADVVDLPAAPSVGRDTDEVLSSLEG